MENQENSGLVLRANFYIIREIWINRNSDRKKYHPSGATKGLFLNLPFTAGTYSFILTGKKRKPLSEEIIEKCVKVTGIQKECFEGKKYIFSSELNFSDFFKNQWFNPKQSSSQKDKGKYQKNNEFNQKLFNEVKQIIALPENRIKDQYKNLFALIDFAEKRTSTLESLTDKLNAISVSQLDEIIKDRKNQKVVENYKAALTKQLKEVETITNYLYLWN